MKFIGIRLLGKRATLKYNLAKQSQYCLSEIDVLVDAFNVY